MHNSAEHEICMLEYQKISVLIFSLLGNFSCFCCLLTFFKIKFLKKFLQKHSECQTVWIQISPDLSVLIWVQTVCKGYKQNTKVVTCKERVNRDVDLEDICLSRFYRTEEMVYGAREFHMSTRKSIRMNLHRTC